MRSVRARRIALLGWLGLAGELLGVALGLPSWPLGSVGIAYGLSGLVALGVEARRSRSQPTCKITQVAPMHLDGRLYAEVWRAYRADEISVVSALLRVEELFAARVGEITDWEAIDWTTSPLEPAGRWEWDGDRLVEKPAPAAGSLDSVTQAMLASFAVPSRHVGCRRCGRPIPPNYPPDGLCKYCAPCPCPTCERMRVQDWQRNVEADAKARAERQYQESLRIFGLIRNNDLRIGDDLAMEAVRRGILPAPKPPTLLLTEASCLACGEPATLPNRICPSCTGLSRASIA